jgi:hypothetical protein
MAGKSKATPTPTPTANADVLGLLGSLPSGGGSSNIGKFDITSNEYDISGLGLPASVTGGKTKLDADSFVKALRKTAEVSPQTWAGIQYALFQSKFYSSTPTFGSWDPSSTTDLIAVKNFMESLTAHNSADPTVAAPVTSYLTDQQNTAIKYGGNAVRTQIAKVQVPNTTDLSYIADKAFRDVLGVGATEKQRKQFAASFQSQIMSAARMSAAATQAQTPTVPSAPSATTPSYPEGFVGPKVPGAAQPTIQQNFQSADMTPKVQVQAVQSAPDANVAAAEFARKADPTQAGVNGLNAAVDTWFKSLGGKGTK